MNLFKGNFIFLSVVKVIMYGKFRSQLDWDKEKRLKSAISGGVKCINPKCGSDKTMTTTAQIRRADEGMTE
jgi:DNA-directed RNA polymerase subunit M/transcription elongation factor TFIIS